MDGWLTREILLQFFQSHGAWRRQVHTAPSFTAEDRIMCTTGETQEAWPFRLPLGVKQTPLQQDSIYIRQPLGGDQVENVYFEGKGSY